ncbi:hypothetical protein LNAT_P0761 [Lebetimonas natsushimae]|uniref:Galanin n=1 Tax=Lebetimonas natsushimae TaxID=1936991 RepID=A0A292YE25_9BACT|nr:DUF3137 domain-containing protein [Lebetimonas natsushimae]GAX87465.1 hypothetical protein LNAT_P0761 [Lebetimonas natsushimae]
MIEELKLLKFRFFLFFSFFIIFNFAMFLIFEKYNLNNIFFFMVIGIIDLFLIINIIIIRKNFDEFLDYIFKNIAKKHKAVYFPKKVIDKAYYSLIENTDYDKYDGWDYTKGENYEFSYVETTKEIEEKDDDGNIKKTEKTVFSGTIYVCKFFYNAKNRYLLTPNTFHLSDILPIFYDDERIKLDYPEFEQIFDVYGPDQIEGRMIFNHNFMDNLIKIYNDIGPFKMFIQNNLCILSFANISPKPVNILDFNKKNLIKAENFYIYFLELHKYFDNKNLII